MSDGQKPVSFVDADQGIERNTLLIAQSQKHNFPLFSLPDAQIEKVGIILKTMKESRDFQARAGANVSLVQI
jgi:hypothetical protein